MNMFFNRIASRIVLVFGALLGVGDDAISLSVGSHRNSRYPRTDSGNSELFAALSGEDVRFDHKRQRWLIWDPNTKRWTEDKQGRVRTLMKETSRHRLEAGIKMPESGDRNSEIKWALASESRKSIEAALELSKSEPPISEAGEDWDTDPWLLGVVNGIVDLRTGAFREATRADKITKFSPVVFAPSATCPRFEGFVREVFGGDADLIRFVQEAIGYSLTGSVTEQCLFACYGDGRNGKSTLLEVILHILGDYGVDLPFSSLEAKQNSSPGEGVNLPGTRFAKSVEMREGRRLDEARIKAWTGGDTISLRPLYKNAFSFKPTHKIWLAFNHKPVITDDSPGMWRRIRLIPFNAKFDGAHADRSLLETLKAEASGILNWAIAGCLAWQRDGLGIPECVKTATSGYQAESDVLGPFLAECCYLGEGVWTTSARLWAKYQDWTSRSGESPLSRQRFAEHLTRRGFLPGEQGHDRTRIWTGLGLLANVASEADAADAE